MTLREVFSSIANAIRSKTGKTDTIQPVNMATEIESIQTGSGGNPLQEVIDNHEGDGKPSAKYLFYNYKGTSLDNVLKSLDFSKVTDMSYMFSNCSNLKSVNIDTKNAKYCSNLFYECNNLESVSIIDLSSIVDYVSHSFYNCKKIKSITFANTSKVKQFNAMFYGCSSLTEINNLDTSNASSMSFLFSRASKLTHIKLNTDKMGSASREIFSYATSLEKIDITRLPNSITMFAYKCYSLKTLIIRTMETIPALESNAFTDCYHFYGTTNSTYNPEGLKDGAIYVPDDKVEALKAATNWSVFADIIKPLSGYVEV